MPRRPTSRALLLACAALALASGATTAQAASPPQPTYGPATVDGSIGEWSLAGDHFAAMYTAGDPSKPQLSDAYLRYDCTTEVLYVLVRQKGAVPQLKSAADAWAAINGEPKKRYTGASGDDGVAPDFAWVGDGYDGDSSHVRGYEASLAIAPGSYTIVLHIEADTESGTATSGTVGFRDVFGTTPLTLDCSGDPGGPTSHPGLAVSKRQQVESTTTTPGSDSTTTPVVDDNDQLTVDKHQQFLSVPAGQTRTATVDCPSGWLVLDGSALVQHVDQGTGTEADVEVLESFSSSPSAYTFTVHNPTSGQAQVQLFVTCVKQTTSSGATLSLGTSATQSCPVGSVAVDPGWRVTSGHAEVTRSEPTADLSGWTFSVSDGGTADLSIRCLSTTTSNGGTLHLEDLVRRVSVPAGQTISTQVTCATGAKGIVASSDLGPVTLLGHEPQPITRVFWLQNTTADEQTVTLDLLCLRITTGRTITTADGGTGGTTTTTRTDWTTSTLPAKAGDKVNYEITVTNTGDTALQPADLVDPKCDAGTLVGNGAGTLAPGQSATYTCSHLLTPADQALGSYSNTATASATPPGDTAITHNSNTVTVALGDAFRALTLRAAQRGTTVRASVRVTLPGSRVELALYPAPARKAKGRPTRLAPLGRTVRRRVSDRANLVARLSPAGKRALARSGKLRLRAVMTVKAPGRAAQKISRVVTLRRAR